ncbi:hypothetical protein AK812_SmicGene39437 [Symbiodinium microadriaticum]|uniref:Uncharacterized protein n=1 Tax=Symbiodinium microadriaticum TaxID=2951 RepID=A0A1Q9CB68_SYMMI|nr:hypothetical protein AK812_SmicGene39437 [Symbiodinium microadriaticum]
MLWGKRNVHSNVAVAMVPTPAHAAEVEAGEAASDPSKDDEAEQAVETAPSSPSASANVRAEDVREDKDSPAASKGDGGFREEGSDSDALQLDGAGEVASALAAMMSAVGGLQKSIGSLEEVELPIDRAPLAVEEKALAGNIVQGPRDMRLITEGWPSGTKPRVP